MLPVLDEFLDDCYPLMTDKEVVEALSIQPTLALLSPASQIGKSRQ